MKFAIGEVIETGLTPEKKEEARKEIIGADKVALTKIKAESIVRQEGSVEERSLPRGHI